VVDARIVEVDHDLQREDQLAAQVAVLAFQSPGS
jgi:hypothetical protein